MVDTFRVFPEARSHLIMGKTLSWEVQAVSRLRPVFEFDSSCCL